MKEDIESGISINVLEDLKARSTWSDEYCFFDINFTVKFDSPSAREHYFNNYRHLRINPPKTCSGSGDIYYVISDPSLVSQPLVIAETENITHLQKIFSHGSNRRRFRLDSLKPEENTCYAVTDTFLSNKPIMIVQEKACLILNSKLWNSYAEVIIFNSILSQIPNHYLLHAGVVSWRETGIVLFGGMKKGKSTITLKLVQNGFKFLSDEVAFIDLATCEVTPFPRAVGLRGDTLSLLPELKKINGGKGVKSLSGDRKWAVDIEDIFFDSLGKKCKIGYLIFLSGFSRDPELKPISKSEVLLESLKYFHAAEDDPFKHLLNFSDVVKYAECYQFVLGADRDENVRVLEDLVMRDVSIPENKDKRE